MKPIKIYRDEDNFTVSSKELFDVLELEEDYSDWLTRIVSENCAEDTTCRKNGKIRIPAEIAKIVAMKAMTEVGCETALYIGQQVRSANISKDSAESQEIKKLKDEIERLKSEIADNKEKIEFYDAIADTKETISVQELAVLMTQNGFHIGEHKLFSLLREDGFLCVKPFNCPSTKTIDKMLMSYHTKLYPTPDKNGFTVGYSPRITQRGVQYFLRHYLAKTKTQRA